MNKLIAVVLLVAVCLGFAGCETKEIQYSISNDGTYYIAIGYEAVADIKWLSVPEEYNGLPIKAIGEKIGSNPNIVKNMTKISLPEGLLCIDTMFYHSQYYKDESNWEKETVNGVICKALYIDNYLIYVEVESDTRMEDPIPFTVKEGTKGIAHMAFESDYDFIVNIPSSVEFIGSSVGSDKSSIETNGEIILYNHHRFRVVFDGTVARWEELNKDLAERNKDTVKRLDDTDYDGSDIEGAYYLYIVNCTDGSLVYD